MTASYAAAALLAAAFCAAAGRRGLFAFDQSILFDAGWRVVSGQVPFRDFVLPFGPVAPWLQGALFALGGTSLRTYLASASLGNALAAVLAFGLVRSLAPRRLAAPLAAGALTAVWFYPPSGTPWFDQTAFLLGLGALALLAGRRTGARPAAATLAGALAAAALLAKQNAALALGPPIAVALLVAPHGVRPDRPLRHLAAFLAGGAAAAAAFAAWLALAADPALFGRWFFGVSGAAAAERLAAATLPRLWVAVAGAGAASRLVLLAGLLGLAAALAPARRGTPDHRRARAAGALAVALAAGQNLFLATANNQPEIALPFTGLAPALAFVAVAARLDALPLAGSGGRRRAATAAGAALALVVAASLAAVGVAASLDRSAHDVHAGGFRAAPDRAPSLAPFDWGHPRVHGREVPAAAVEALVADLRAAPRPFFVFPDATFLYGLLGRPSPQPLLWFHPGLSYPAGGSSALDRWIVATLERHRVERVVVGEVSWLGTAERLADFPLLAGWIAACFEPEARHGPFTVLGRRSGVCEAAGRPVSNP